VLLPNAERAFIDIRKLSAYSLDPTHPVGRHKAIVFRSALGLTLVDAEMLVRLILDAVLVSEVTIGRRDEFGQRYSVDFPLISPGGLATIRSAWVVRFDEDFPRLTTCFVLSE
jgi:hypothetical protein